MARLSAVALALLPLLSIGQVNNSSGASPDRVIFQAQHQYVEGSVLHLSGSVELTSNRQVIHSDEASFNVATGEVKATGNVRVVAIGRSLADAPVAEGFRTNLNKPGLAWFAFRNIPQ